MQVFLLILDAFDPRRLDPHLTPNLWDWANRDGAVAGTGESVMASCTYPNHASFVTGLEPERHGIHVNHVLRGNQVFGAWEVGPTVPTLFDRIGTDSIAVLGDHHLVGVMNARSAGEHWPPNGDLPGDCQLDPLGYPADDSVEPHLVRALKLKARFITGYFGSIDTYSHLHGPDSDEALAAYHRLDARLPELEAATDWDDSVVIVVSDHVQDTASDRPGIDLRSIVGEEITVIDEGSAALCGPGVKVDLALIDGVEGYRRLADGSTLVWCQRGRHFGATDWPIFRGVHGGNHTRTQLALVTGGHPQRHRLAAEVRLGPVPAPRWAQMISELI